MAKGFGKGFVTGVLVQLLLSQVQFTHSRKK